MSEETRAVTLEYERALHAATFYNPGEQPDIAELMRSAYVHGYARALIDGTSRMTATEVNWLNHGYSGPVTQDGLEEENRRLRKMIESIRQDLTPYQVPSLVEITALCKELADALAAAKRTHSTCENEWYSCPLSSEGCLDDRETECNCGAEAHNAAIDAALAKYRELVK